MAVKMIRSCDFEQGCTNEASATVTLNRGDVVYRADICDDHASLLTESVNLEPVAAQVGGKTRDVYTAASGKTFSAAEARRWLVDQGIKKGTSAGRVSMEHLELYAAQH